MMHKLTVGQKLSFIFSSSGNQPVPEHEVYAAMWENKLFAANYLFCEGTSEFYNINIPQYNPKSQVRNN